MADDPFTYGIRKEARAHERESVEVRARRREGHLTELVVRLLQKIYDPRLRPLGLQPHRSGGMILLLLPLLLLPQQLLPAELLQMSKWTR